MSGPYQINVSNDDDVSTQPEDYSSIVYSDTEEDVLDYAAGTYEAEDDNGRTVTVTEVDEDS